jgi:hypothetical protein
MAQPRRFAGGCEGPVQRLRLPLSSKLFRGRVRVMIDSALADWQSGSPLVSQDQQPRQIRQAREIGSPFSMLEP